jgi:hypothetical protein
MAVGYQPLLAFELAANSGLHLKTLHDWRAMMNHKASSSAERVRMFSA